MNVKYKKLKMVGKALLTVSMISGIFGVPIILHHLYTQRNSIYQQKEQQLIINKQYINNDTIEDLIIIDGNGIFRDILYGQEDGTYKNLKQIIADKYKKHQESLKKYK